MIICVVEISNIICTFRAFVIAGSIYTLYDNILTLSPHTPGIEWFIYNVVMATYITGEIVIITGSRNAKLYSLIYACG